MKKIVATIKPFKLEEVAIAKPARTEKIGDDKVVSPIGNAVRIRRKETGDSAV